MTTPSPEPLKLVEECLEICGYCFRSARNGKTFWVNERQELSVEIDENFPLNNDFAAICKQFMRDQKLTARITLPWNEGEEHSVRIMLWTTDNYCAHEVTGKSENETWARAVLQVAEEVKK